MKNLPRFVVLAALFAVMITCLPLSSAFAQLDFGNVIVPGHQGYPTLSVVGDFDGNGRQDLIVSTNPLARLRVFYTNDVNNYTDKELYLTTWATWAHMSAGDLNEDGKDDLVLTEQGISFSENLIVALSTGNDFQKSAFTLPFGTSPWKSFIVDFDNDTHLDIIAIANSQEARFFKGDGLGNFSVSVTDASIATPASPFEFEVQDINNDGRLDIIILTQGVLQTYIKNAGAGYTTASIENYPIPRTDVEPVLLVADFNGDHTPDVVAKADFFNGTDWVNAIDFMSNNGDGTFADPVPIPVGSGIGDLDHADYDGDGLEDLVVAASEPGAITVLHNSGNAIFDNKPFPSNDPEFYAAQAVNFIDLDGIGAKEIVYVTSPAKTRWIQLNNNEWEGLQSMIFTVSPGDGVAYDIDHDGIKDIITAGNAAYSIAIRYGKGGFQYEDPVYVPFRKGFVWAVDVADFNNDGYGDLVYSTSLQEFGDPEPEYVAVRLSTGARTFGQAITVHSDSHTLGVADLDNDGDTDIFTDTGIIKNNGAGQFSSTPLSLPSIFYSDGRIVSGHFNDDGFRDLVFNHFNKLYVVLNDGVGNFPIINQIDVSSNIEKIQAANVNNDEYSDIIGVFNDYPNQISKVIILTGIGNGQFTESIITPVPGAFATLADAADMDGDALPDIVIMNYYFGSGELGVYTGLAGGGFTSVNSFGAEHSPDIHLQRSLVSQLVDLNNDSKLDVLSFQLDDIGVAIFPNTTDATDPGEPTQATIQSIVPTDVTAAIDLQKGNGTGRLVLIREQSVASENPVDGIFYNPNPQFGSGQHINSNFIVLEDDRSNVTVTGLTPGTTYVATVFEYNSSFKLFINYSNTASSMSFTTFKQQSITINNTDNNIFGTGNNTVTASSNSGLDVELTLISGSGTISTNTFTPSSPGQVKLKATQAGNSEYVSTEKEVTFCIYPEKPVITESEEDILTSSSETNNIWLFNDNMIPGATEDTYEPTAAGDYSVKVVVNGCESVSETIVVPLKTQSISFDNIFGNVFGVGDNLVFATSTSDLNVELTLILGDGTIDGDTYTPSRAGKVTLKATQAGDAQYLPAEKSVTFCVYPVVGEVTYTDDPEPLFTSSVATGNQWYFGTIDIPGATGQTFKPLVPGNYQLIATTADGCESQSGVFSVEADTPQTITFENVDHNVFNVGNDVVTATSTSNLDVELTLVSGRGTIDGNAFTPSAPGQVTLEAFQFGNAKYLPKEESLTFCVHPAHPQITRTNESELTLSSSSDEGNTWFFNNNAIPGADDKTFKPTVDGVYLVMVTIDGCESTLGSISVIIPTKSQSITFDNIENNIFGTGNNQVTATSTSELDVSLTLISGNGTVTGFIFTPDGPGQYELKAIQAGNDEYIGTEKTVIFCVYPAKPEIAVLSEEPEVILGSSASDGNVWMLNEEVIEGAEGETYKPTSSGNYTVKVVVDGCESSESVTVTHPDVTTGLGDDWTKGISISPNPARDFVTISSPQRIERNPVLYNTVGVAFNVPMTRSGNSIQLNTSDLQAGLYILRIENLSLKLLKQ